MNISLSSIHDSRRREHILVSWIGLVKQDSPLHSLCAADHFSVFYAVLISLTEPVQRHTGKIVELVPFGIHSVLEDIRLPCGDNFWSLSVPLLFIVWLLDHSTIVLGVLACKLNTLDQLHHCSVVKHSRVFALVGSTFCHSYPAMSICSSTSHLCVLPAIRFSRPHSHPKFLDCAPRIFQLPLPYSQLAHF